MATIQRFEDLDIWIRSRKLSTEIFQTANSEPFSKDFALKNQILRASGSIMDNIAEGFERNGKKEFIQFLSIAKGSSGEVRSQIYRAFDNGYIDENIKTNLINKYSELNMMIKGLIDYLKQSELKGVKYK